MKEKNFPGTAFQKVNVNGPKAHPVFKWLKANSPEWKSDVQWNFEAWLVSPSGGVLHRYQRNALPTIEQHIRAEVKEL